jgi:magnesium chelatase family protein
MSRAHGGILFLDEMPEFTRPALEGMRQPLEEKEVRLQRAQDWAKYPADVIMLATSNPCPCGYLSHPKIPCRCSETRIETYLSRVSGPLQDRFDLFVEMGPVAADVLDGPATAQSDEDVIARITAAKEFQRSKDRVFTCSNEASLAQIIEAGILPEAQTQMRKASTLLALSGRAVLRCLRVARSNADLNQRAAIALEDVQQALGFRPLSAQQKTTTDKHRLAQRLKTHHPSRATYSNNRDSPSKSPYSR